VRGYVGVTDGDWYRFLADRPEVSAAEVNFWRPGGGRGFHALAEGEPFFFKTHAPHNRVVGGGFYSGFTALLMSEAWQMFGLANGVASLDEMRMRIARYRREPMAPSEDPEIGCVFVRDVTFFPEGMAHDPPPGFALNIVQGKSYDMADVQVSQYFGDLMQLVLGKAIEIDFSQPWHKAGPVFGDPRLAPYDWDNSLSKPSSSGRITGTARSPRPRSVPYSRQHTSGLSPTVVSTASIMDCSCAPMCTPCSTAAISRLTTSTGYWSARACGANSETATTSTPKSARSSTYQTERSIARNANSCNGISTRCSRRPDARPGKFDVCPRACLV
jgi:hypothetical protein